jgi:hypothetical protein
MAQLSASGAVPLKDGMIDLDGSYEAAIKLRTDISSLIQKEAADKAAKEAKAKSDREAKEKAERLARARRAGSGFKPSASSMAPVTNQSSKLNGKDTGKSPSVRDSIRAAFQELSE